MSQTSGQASKNQCQHPAEKSILAADAPDIWSSQPDSVTTSRQKGRIEGADGPDIWSSQPESVQTSRPKGRIEGADEQDIQNPIKNQSFTKT